MNKTTGFHLAILCAVAAVMIFLYGTIDYDSPPFRWMDMDFYRDMAAASPRLAEGIRRPFAYRLLGPYLVGLMPFSNELGFLVLTDVVSILIPLLLYVFLLEFGIERRAALFAAMLYLFNMRLFGFTAWNFFQVKDTLSFAFIAACFIAMLRSNWPLFLFSLLGGVLSGEYPLIVVPVLFVYLAERHRPRQDWIRGAISVLPGIAAFILVRTLVTPKGGRSLIDAFLMYAPKLRLYQTWGHLLVNPYMPLAVVPLVYVRNALRFALENRYLVVMFALTFVGALFGQNNERLMAPSFVPFYAFIGRIVEDRWRRSRTVLILVACACFVSCFHYNVARFPLPSRAVMRVIVITAAALVTLLSYLSSRSQWGRGKARNLAP